MGFQIQTWSDRIVIGGQRPLQRPGRGILLTRMHRTALEAELGYYDRGPPSSSSFITIIANTYAFMGQGSLLTYEPCNTSGLP